MRRIPLLAVVACLLAPIVPPTVAHADDAAEQAAREIADARDAANAAADAYFAAESRIEQLEIDAQQLEGEVATLQSEIDALLLQVQNVAVNRYTRSGTMGIGVLTGFRNPAEQVQIDALIDVINASSADDLDRFDSLNRDLVAKQRRLADTQTRAQNEKASLGQLADAANAKVEKLKQVEAQRLQDEAVRKAVQAEQAERARREEALKARQAPVAAPANPQDSGSDDIDSPSPSAPAIKPSSSSGQTGVGGGSGGNAIYAGVDWVCPTGSASVAFGDTWGAPRSGGRRHQGVDMIGARGTPILAVVDGFAKPKSNTLGGTTIWFTGADGNAYYYAHLDSYGALGAVSKGDVIGYMGDTGNAKQSVVHLHFEIHPGGGPAVNPYPTVRARC
jgi:murein DD-endopeptidase MepM/ murein hydrolase activator NlpD